MIFAYSVKIWNTWNSKAWHWKLSHDTIPLNQRREYFSRTLLKLPVSRGKRRERTTVMVLCDNGWCYALVLSLTPWPFLLLSPLPTERARYQVRHSHIFHTVAMAKKYSKIRFLLKFYIFLRWYIIYIQHITRLNQ